MKKNRYFLIHEILFHEISTTYHGPYDYNFTQTTYTKPKMQNYSSKLLNSKANFAFRHTILLGLQSYPHVLIPYWSLPSPSDGLTVYVLSVKNQCRKALYDIGCATSSMLGIFHNLSYKSQMLSHNQTTSILSSWSGAPKREASCEERNSNWDLVFAI